MDVEYAATEYSTASGERYEAVQVEWAEVTRILGREHEGTQEEDAALVAALRADGAPAWVQTAAGWTDEIGWGLIGPAVDRG